MVVEHRAKDRAEDELERSYRLTFAEYARCVDDLERLRREGQPNVSAVETAVLAVERARLENSAARDRLAGHLGGGHLGDGLPDRPSFGFTDGEVRQTAHLLWEFSGRPSDTAERDWHRARQLVSVAAGR